MAGNTLTDTGDGWIIEATKLFEDFHHVTPKLGAQALASATVEVTDALSLFDIAI
jgi:hypothetical protein